MTRDSHADTVSNGISGNGADGIEVGDYSTIQLGEDSGTSIFEAPNSSMGSNAGFGLVRRLISILLSPVLFGFDTKTDDSQSARFVKLLNSRLSRDLVVLALAMGLSLAIVAKRAGGISFDEAFGIAVDSSGNSYVTGFFQGSATFGAGEANATTLGSPSQDFFVAKYNPNGALVWAKHAGGTGLHIKRPNRRQHHTEPDRRRNPGSTRFLRGDLEQSDHR